MARIVSPSMRMSAEAAVVVASVQHPTAAENGVSHVRLTSAIAFPRTS